MASANVELVRSIFAAWERGDFGSARWADPEIEYVRADGPEPGRWKGLARMAENAREYLGAWEEYSLTAEEYRELDAERVLVLDRRSGRGATSGVDLGQMRARGAHLFHVSGGRVARLVAYANRERAFADIWA